jgi:hypothetical protein
MDIVDPESLTAHDDDHPTGALRQKYLFRGEAGSPDNFEFSLAQTTKRFEMIRHRHNFDQFRFTVRGDMSMGPDRVLREGCLGYFPEGAPYGPQDDGAGPVALVLQFGGASGYGYMTMPQYRQGRDSLRKQGRFDGAVYLRNEGEPGQRKKFSINAIWEESTGQRMLIPTPRYDKPIFINPEAFRWIPYRSAAGVVAGVARKALGTFSERETLAEMWRVQAGATLELHSHTANRLLFVLEGSASAAGKPIGRHFALRIVPGAVGRLAARNELTLLSFVLPPVGMDWTQAEAPSFEPMPGEAVPDTFKEG